VQLDARLEEARKTVEQLQTLQSELSQNSFQDTSTRGAEQQEILRLARQGLDADTIAQRIRKPRGEVELILKLHRLSKR
jgi:DNA-binding NarL/FixJ family response regulator